MYHGPCKGGEPIKLHMIWANPIQTSLTRLLDSVARGAPDGLGGQLESPLGE
jgi:hypothetical protein